MNIISISYKEHTDSKKLWKYNTFDLSPVNLIIGKNATGKSRILSSIRGLSQIFSSPVIPFQNGEYNVTIKGNNIKYDYSISILHGFIKQESLKINDLEYLTRDDNGLGEITGEDSKTKLKFKIPHNQFAVARRDEIQHPSLAALFEWGTSLRYFKFAKDQEKESLVAQNSNVITEKENLSNAVAISIFQKGQKEFSKKFIKSIINNMNEIGYDIESLEIGIMSDIKVLSLPFPTELSGILVKEKDCQTKISQVHMSDGMFRALAILIHFNYYKLKGISGTILIDDIGEGLDFERSSKLIKILVNDAENSNIQLIMSTNDKFIMNSVSLDYWQVISRAGSEITIFNKKNSKTQFDNFKFTGLNNFDFFSSDFINEIEE